MHGGCVPWWKSRRTQQGSDCGRNVNLERLVIDSSDSSLYGAGRKKERGFFGWFVRKHGTRAREEGGKPISPVEGEQARPAPHPKGFCNVKTRRQLHRRVVGPPKKAPGFAGWAAGDGAVDAGYWTWGSTRGRGFLCVNPADKGLPITGFFFGTFEVRQGGRPAFARQNPRMASSVAGGRTGRTGPKS